MPYIIEGFLNKILSKDLKVELSIKEFLDEHPEYTLNRRGDIIPNIDYHEPIIYRSSLLNHRMPSIDVDNLAQVNSTGVKDSVNNDYLLSFGEGRMTDLINFLSNDRIQNEVQEVYMHSKLQEEYREKLLELKGKLEELVAFFNKSIDEKKDLILEEKIYKIILS